LKFSELIPKKEGSVNLLYEIIKLLKKEKVSKLAEFIENHLLDGI